MTPIKTTYSFQKDDTVTRRIDPKGLSGTVTQVGQQKVRVRWNDGTGGWQAKADLILRPSQAGDVAEAFYHATGLDPKLVDILFYSRWGTFRFMGEVNIQGSDVVQPALLMLTLHVPENSNPKDGATWETWLAAQTWMNTAWTCIGVDPDHHRDYGWLYRPNGHPDTQNTLRSNDKKIDTPNKVLKERLGS